MNIDIETGDQHQTAGDVEEVLTPQRLYTKSLSSLSLPKWSSMTGLCPKQSSGSGLAQSLWPLFLNFWKNEIAQLQGVAGLARLRPPAKKKLDWRGFEGRERNSEISWSAGSAAAGGETVEGKKQFSIVFLLHPLPPLLPPS